MLQSVALMVRIVVQRRFWQPCAETAHGYSFQLSFVLSENPQNLSFWSNVTGAHFLPLADRSSAILKSPQQMRSRQEDDAFTAFAS